MAFSLVDRRGRVTPLRVRTDQPETVAEVLLRSHIAPPSVLVFQDGRPVPDSHPVDPQQDYQARLIEGFDLSGILEVFQQPGAGREWSAGVYDSRRLVIAPTGELGLDQRTLDDEGVRRQVEATVEATVQRFALVDSSERLLLGLSGGVDSGSLLMLLAPLQEHASGSFKLVAATFEDFDSRYSASFDRAGALARQFGVEHHVLPAGLAESVFHLLRPLNQILLLLMETDDAHEAMYADHHTTRRTLEVFAVDQHCGKIALGLHATDLLAGLLNSYAAGYRVGGIPSRRIGDFTYIFPLAFVPKRELHLYYMTVLREAPAQTTPNQWEFNPRDRNFYYYVADHLQWIWPGIQAWLFANHRYLQPAPNGSSFAICENCGASVLLQDAATVPGGLCDVCSLFERHGWVRGS
jgi:tRNA(Ile)-lysidine synthase TilS/MesJ